ncbi:energy-coupling factor transporter transmembrane protein EcfT [Nocardioides sp. HDW12B]|uniref:energy-coupling factor transporter transmembrane component T family protein n=1 Tax=Nocardioides sp. HDW12B TaxID=2714939 RepID=UPI0014089C2B|nr:energy-coupling factor transporter transmembrane protein EcfT [Nocardioides sp. HDW12B]QIK67177.1 energy-coupling factor transporter transmembrane protein EcfT [Nocardioides sp. HDW12B]
MSQLGLFVPGTSVVHRLPARVKLGALVAAGVGSLWLDTLPRVGLMWLALVLAYAVARIPLRSVVAQIRPLALILGAVVVFQVLVAGWERAVVVVGVVGALVLLAGLVTLTTRTQDLLDVVVAVVRPLRHVGVDPERVGLLMALAIRSVPVVLGLAEEVRDAQRARGVRPSARAYAAPLIIRAVRHADDLGEALVARGVDD